jgi:hypothetical protein
MFRVRIPLKKHFNDEQLHAPPSAKINADKNDHFNEVSEKKCNLFFCTFFIFGCIR